MDYKRPTVVGFKNPTSPAVKVGWHATPIRVKPSHSDTPTKLTQHAGVGGGDGGG